MNISVENMCRTCLTCDGHLISIFDVKSTVASSIAEMVTAITSIKVLPSDGLPKRICLSCVSEVNRAYSFRIKCENSDITLKQLFFNNEQILRESNNDVNVKVEENLPQKQQQQQYQINNLDFHKLESKKTTTTTVSTIDEQLSLIFDDEKPGNDCDGDEEIDTEINDTVEFLEQEKENETYEEIKESSNTIYAIDDGCNDDDNNQQQSKHERGEEEQQEDCNKQLEVGNSQHEIHVENVNDDNHQINDKEDIIILGCADCGGTFDNSSKFQEHINKCTEENKKKMKTNKKEKKCIKCPYCPVDFVHKKNLEKHINKYHDKNMNRSKINEQENNRTDEKEIMEVENYQDSECVIEEVDIIDLKHNQQVFNAPFKCYNCGAGFVKEKSLSYHLKLNKCTEEQFGCVSCKKVFIDKNSLFQHMKTHIIFSCSKCTKTFSNQDKLNTHIEVEHSNVKKYKCSYCSKVFSMQSSLTDHIRTHSGEKPFLCSLCGKAFTQNTNLKQHMMRHTKTKPFQCSQCNYSFVSKGELNSHLRKHTGDHPFTCDTCGVSFTTSSSLVKHRRRHTGERPYACEYCPMRFTALGILKNHRRTHTGEKPFVCKFCTRSFAQKSDCVTHMRTHTGEKPYTCSECGIGFQQCSTLKSHMKSIHNTIYQNKSQQITHMKDKNQQNQHIELDSEVIDDILAMQVDNDVLSIPISQAENT